MVLYTFTPHSACLYYGNCSNCPFLDYPYCTYDGEDGGVEIKYTEWELIEMAKKRAKAKVFVEHYLKKGDNDG